MGEGSFSLGIKTAAAEVVFSAADSAVTSSTSRPRLCVGMATYDDFDGVWFTIQAIAMYQAEVLADVTFLVIDNNPDGPAASALRALEKWLPRYRCVPFDGYNGTSVRDLVFREARADIVCCVDSHILLRPGALAALLDWFSAHPHSRDLLQGPLLYNDLKVGATHMEPTWGAGMFGRWGRDPRIDEPECEPFEVAMQGLGLFACRREAWPGLNPRLRGFGGEEGYLHEKFRQRGGRVLCHPGLAWLHRFGRPRGVSYPNIWDDRVRNYTIAWSEIGWDLAPAYAHFRELLGPGADAVLERACRQAEHPVNAFDGVFCLADEAAADDTHAHPPDLSWRIERLVPPPGLGPEQRRLAGWQQAVTSAAHRGYRHLLVLDGSAPAGVTMPAPDDRDWDLCLLRPAGPAVAVHERAFKQLLADLPGDEAGQAEFLSTWSSLDRYLVHLIADGTFTAVQALPPGPGADRPQRAAGTEVSELEQGLLVRPTGPAQPHLLSNTAAVIWDLCDGQRTVFQIAADLAAAFGLDNLPLAEVTDGIAGLRRAGILIEPIHYANESRES
jgi:hypothetical protein